jgi:agmatine/peptidylarginine deiminase
MFWPVLRKLPARPTSDLMVRRMSGCLILRPTIVGCATTDLPLLSSPKRARWLAFIGSTQLGVVSIHRSTKMPKMEPAFVKRWGYHASLRHWFAKGGGLETDGEGTLLTTTSCLQSASRNPERSPAWITQHLSEMLGVSKVIWLEGTELDGDDTDGHIDQLARFVAPGRVVVAARGIDVDTNIESLQSLKQQLSEVTDARGRKLELIDLPTPPPRWINGQRVPESYCNFYIANGIVLVPTFQHRPSDERAIGILKEQFPYHRIVPLDAADMIWGLGAFHCGSQQQPKPALRERVDGSEE